MTTQYNTQEDAQKLAAIYAKMEELRTLTAGMGQDIVDYTDTELAAIKAQIALLDQDGVTASLAAIEAFIAGIDGNADGVIDSLAALTADITAAAATATAALEKANTVAAGLQSVINTQNAQQGELDANRGDINDHKSRLDILEAREDNAGLSESQVRAIAVQQDRILLQAMVDAAPDFADIVLTKAYPITGSSTPTMSDPMPSSGAVESV